MPADPAHSTYLSEVWVTFGDGEPEQKLFGFYPDELSFTADEFLDLTREEARSLFHKRDVEYLRS